MKARLYTCFILTLFFSAQALAHGEDKLGPHGGFIRMPGAFHTEVVPMGKDKAKIYLLDINWQNPSVKGAEVDARVGSKGQAKCSVHEGSYFLCLFPQGTDLSKKGQLNVKARRESQLGNEVIYELPFKLQMIDEGHKGH